MNRVKQQNGFTIIEVVLVLAIAALIFLMIFIALPALQRNQRDTARKNDASVVSSAVTNFTSNQRRAFKSEDASELVKYIDRLDQYEPKDVSVVAGLGTQSEREDKIVVIPGMKCDGAKVVKGSTRTAAIVVVLENNGNKDNKLDYCQDA